MNKKNNSIKTFLYQPLKLKKTRKTMSFTVILKLNKNVHELLNMDTTSTVM